MKSQMVEFPSIEQFRSTVKHVNDYTTHNGLTPPKVSFLGTVKLHGTNAAVCAPCGAAKQMWAQSRSNVITPEQDNAGFAAFVEANKDVFAALLTRFDFNEQSDDEAPENSSIVSIYGEWCGANIQKGVALTGLPKMFVIFGAAISSGVDDKGQIIRNWLPPEEIQKAFNEVKTGYGYAIGDGLSSQMPAVAIPDSIKCILDFPVWKVQIDFAEPAAKQNELVAITNAVEAECPVGKALGVTGVGEGVVWQAVSSEPNLPPHVMAGLTFKVKGEKHSSSKVKTLAAVDTEKLESLGAFYDSVMTEARLEQGLEVLRRDGHEISAKSTGHFIKWVAGDVVKEESDTMQKNGFEAKDVMPGVSAKARTWFLNKLKTA